jgi:hypothetical protein
LSVTLFVVSPPSLQARHEILVPGVSAVSVVASTQSAPRMIDSGSRIVQLTVTLLRYQPAEPSVPTVVGVISGGVGSPSTATAPGTTSSAAPTTTLRAVIPRSRRPRCRGTRSRRSSGHKTCRAPHPRGAVSPPEANPSLQTCQIGTVPRGTQDEPRNRRIRAQSRLTPANACAPATRTAADSVAMS